MSIEWFGDRRRHDVIPTCLATLLNYLADQLSPDPRLCMNHKISCSIKRNHKNYLKKRDIRVARFEELSIVRRLPLPTPTVDTETVLIYAQMRHRKFSSFHIPNSTAFICRFNQNNRKIVPSKIAQLN